MTYSAGSVNQLMALPNMHLSSMRPWLSSPTPQKKKKIKLSLVCKNRNPILKNSLYCLNSANIACLHFCCVYLLGSLLGCCHEPPL